MVGSVGTSANSRIVIGCLVTGALTGAAAMILLEKYAVTLREINYHDGMSFTWRVYSLVGVGLLVGTLVNVFIRVLSGLFSKRDKCV